MNISQVKGYIFDLDGTLIDSMPLWYNVDRIFLSEHGINPPDNISEIVKKMTVEQSSKYFLDTFNLKVSQQDIINRIEEIVAENYEKTIPLKDGISELLDYLDSKNIPYGVATATYRSLAVACLTRLGLINRIKFLETCSEIGKGKEFPDIFFKCAERLGLPPESIAVVEDSLYCLETAKNHGFFTIAVYDKSSNNDWDTINEKTANKSFYSANDLLEYVQGHELYLKSPLYEILENHSIFDNYIIKKYDENSFISDMYTSDNDASIDIYSISATNLSKSYSPKDLICEFILKNGFWDNYEKDYIYKWLNGYLDYYPDLLNYYMINQLGILAEEILSNYIYTPISIKKFLEVPKCYSFIDKNIWFDTDTQENIIEKYLFNLKDMQIYRIIKYKHWSLDYETYIAYNKNQLFICRIGLIKDR